jgi:PAS domain S-box-containing protein
MDWLKQLFSGEGFVPRRVCGDWTQVHIAVHVASDILIGLAYFSIPYLLYRITCIRKDLPFPRVFLWGAAFVTLCAGTHFMNMTMFIHPLYRLEAAVKVVTAIVSWIAFFRILEVVPLIEQFKSPTQLEEVVKERTKELEEANRQVRHNEFLLKDFFENAPVGLHWINEEGRIIRANRADCQLAGYELEEYIGKHIADIFLDEEVVKSIISIDEDRAAVHDMETAMRCKDGSIKHVLVSSNILCEDGKFIHTRCFVRDITERKQREDQLRASLEEKKEEAALKENFLAMLAHELRNPLAPLQNCVQILQMSPDRETTENSISMMERQVQHMSRMIDDLIYLSKLRRSRIELRTLPTKLLDVSLRSVEMIKALVVAKDHRFYFDPPDCDMRVLGDEARLIQVLSGMLENAFKYTTAPGTITLRMFRQEDNGVFEIEDDGIGMDARTVTRIFEPFFQADHTLARTKGGLGIGLSLAKNVVEMHGGKIDVLSETGVGTKFTISLPLLTQEGDWEVGRQQTLNGGGRKVLVVDDNTDSAESVALMLTLDEFVTKFVFTGEAALECVEEFQPDAILLDIGLPDVTGYEVCRRLRQIPCCKDVLIAAMTGYGQDEDREKSAAAGMNYHLMKPLKYPVLNHLLVKGMLP